MSVIFAKPDEPILKRAVAIMHEHHEDLTKAGVRVAVLMASRTDGECALKINKVPVTAQVKLVDVKMRVLGVADIIICVDTEAWSTLRRPSQDALLDRELRHVQVEWGKEGDPKTDCAGRPVLSFRPCDWHLSGFAETVRIYGAEALDAMEISAFLAGEHGKVVQPFLPGLSPAARAPAAADPDEAVLAQAVDVIRETKRAALGTLQRRLRLTHTQAARVMDHLLERGIVGPPNGNEPREILLDVKSPTASAAA